MWVAFGILCWLLGVLGIWALVYAQGEREAKRGTEI